MSVLAFSMPRRRPFSITMAHASVIAPVQAICSANDTPLKPLSGGRIAAALISAARRERQLRDGVVEHPADHGGVVAGGGDDHDEEKPSDGHAERKAAGRKRADRAAPRVPAERELGHQRGHADDDGDEGVEEDERRAAEHADHVREAPHVPETDGHADDRHEGAKARAKGFAGAGHHAGAIVCAVVINQRRCGSHIRRAAGRGRPATFSSELSVAEAFSHLLVPCSCFTSRPLTSDL